MLNKPGARWYAVQVSDTRMLMSDLQFVTKNKQILWPPKQIIFNRLIISM